MSRVITDCAEATCALSDMTARKDAAYLERNRCVALIARMALVSGWRAGIARTAIEGWSEDWHGCVYVDLPTGQTSWHYHDSQAHLFADLPAYTGTWDGHDTPEKYRRVDAAFSAGSQEPLWNLSRLDLQPGDAVLMHVPTRLQSEQRAYLMKHFKQVVPDHKVMVLDGGLRITTMRTLPANSDHGD